MKKFLACAAAVTLASSAAFFCGCADRTESRVARTLVMDTAANLVITADFTDTDVVARSAALNKKVKSYLAEFENSLSVAVESSYIYKFNGAAAGETVEIDALSYRVLSEAKRLYEFTEGYFNPAVYYSADLYGFTANSDYPVKDGGVNANYKYPLMDGGLPSGEYVSAFKELSAQFSNVTLTESGGKYYAKKPESGSVTVGETTYNLKIDLGGMKGFAVDAVGGMMAEAGFEYGFFDLGGSSYCVKKSYVGEDKKWKMSAANPRSQKEPKDSFTEYSVGDECVSTSGDYEYYYEIAGERYCHIINPFTGAPIRTGIACVTVIGGTAAEADAFTTAISCMGKEKAVEFINAKLSDKKVIFVVADGDNKEVVTNRPDFFKLVGEGFTLANTVENGKIVLN